MSWRCFFRNQFLKLSENGKFSGVFAEFLGRFIYASALGLSRTDYLCEMKFSESVFSINADYNQNIRKKIVAFSESPQHDMTHSIQVAIVASFGIAKGEYTDVVNHVVSLDSLFK